MAFLPIAIISAAALFIVFAAAVAVRLRREGKRYVISENDAESFAPAPLVSVVVPARDEEVNLADCLKALCAQTHSRLEIIVVDDRSADGTARVAAELSRLDPRVRLVSGEEPPPGWVGKNFALSQGVRQAKGEWYWFVDADTRQAPGALGTALGHAGRHGLSALSVTGAQECRGLLVRLMHPIVFRLLDLLYPLSRINDPSDSLAAANGNFFLIEQEAYERVGGHEAVRGEVVEDVAIARVLKQKGERYRFLRSRDLFHVRMYRSAAALWEGWRKNIGALVGGTPFRMLAAAAAVVLFGTGPLVLVLLGGRAWLGGNLGGGAAAMISVLLLLAFFAWEGARRKAEGLGLAEGLLAPLGYVMVALLILDSGLRRGLGRGVIWKGRRYP